MSSMHASLLGAAIAMWSAALLAQSPATTPSRATNLQYYPKDISRQDLLQRMREFSFALGVRCTHCHDMPEGAAIGGPEFAADTKDAKRKARVMLHMVDRINTTLLAALPSRAEPRVVVTCATCHHGLPLPKSLQTTLFEIVQTDGVPAAIARYRELRESEMGTGTYDFGQWEINELARRLKEADNPRAAIAVLELNQEFYPKSASIDYELGELHLALGERDAALRRYRQAVEKSPNHEPARRRIAEIEKQ